MAGWGIWLNRACLTRRASGSRFSEARSSTATSAAWSQLWTRQVTLGPENITIEVCYPVAPARGDIEIAYRRLNLRSDVVPIKLRIFVKTSAGVS
jgi:hypothetical protein